ncbi:MAG: bifunctional 5,10-methylenetetrahydrofolate dehydrogenase/5,10-methenyltetrahydrofolate cyclohydrolase [Coriobacteriaceae bacterium]|nr:bifunctional 5,10-methylenetetrahydrofolate dehydrogenase/5,10-methenyltetrahydrofolate cyclohydrolase [Coriobacteriaceae bacterium]
MSKLLLGKPVADAMTEDLAVRVDALKAAGVQPVLAIVRVGERPDDLSYERGVTKRAQSVGVDVRPFVLAEDASQQQLEAVIRQVNEDASIHGCLMFRPLPAHLDEDAACALLAPEKDVDAVSPAALAGVFADLQGAFAPSTAVACMKVLDHYGIDPEGKKVAVIGRSLVIGKPVAMLLLARNATVTICHSRTRDLARTVREAEIVICATGRARAYGADFFREGQTVIDVGINVDAEGKLCGDVDFESVEDLVDAITPVPRGVGSVTSAVTVGHTVQAAERALV